MRNSKVAKALSISLVSGILLALALLNSLALAQTSEEVQYWLVLDSAREMDGPLPLLLNRLAELKVDGRISDFKPEPQRSAPQAASCVQVFAAPHMYDDLRRLPGVLDVVKELPPPPLTLSDFHLLAVTGEITGVVTDESDGQPIAGADVKVYDGVSFALLDKVGTDASGQYTVTVTAPYSRAKVYAESSEYRPEWYEDKSYFSEANAITLQAGGVVTGVNLALEPTGAISVTLTLDGGGAPSEVSVDACDVETGYIVDGCLTNDAGQCVIEGVEAGVYKLRFSSFYLLGPGETGIVMEWYEDEESRDAATPVTVTSQLTTEVTGQVTENGILSGTVTDESSGAKLADIDVEVYDVAGNLVGSDLTGDGSGFLWPKPLGQYYIRLKPGTYWVDFEDEAGILYQSEWYSDAASMSGADWVTITSGVTATASAALAPVTPTGTITGQVTKFGGNPLEGGIFVGEEIVVDLYNAETGSKLGRALKFEGDGSTTLYTATVPAGEYKVHFSPWFYANDEWYSNTDSISTATVITVTDGGIVTDINADLEAWVEVATGCITGMLTSNGVPVAGEADVCAYHDGLSYCSTLALSGGVYKLCNLEAGDYKVSFSKFPSATTWYSDTLFRSSATTVSVTANITTPHVDGNLDDLGGCISGKVVDPGGEPVAGAYVNIYDPDGNRISIWVGWWGTYFDGYVDLDDDGGFVACGLQPGAYKLCGTQHDWMTGEEMSGCNGPITVAGGESTDAGELVIGHQLYLPLVMRNNG